MTHNSRFETITAIVVVGSQLPSIEVFQGLEATLSDVAIDHEIVVIANSVSSEVAQGLRMLSEKVPNVTIHFLAQYIDRDTAILIGIDHALGDWIVVLTPTKEEIECLPYLLTKVGAYEIVFAGARELGDIPDSYRWVARAYFRLYELVTGSTVDWPAPRIRVYSRAAARYLASLLDGEFALRSLTFSGAFPGIRESITGLPQDDLDLPTPGQALRKAIRGLLNATAVPLRAVIGTALLGGLGATFTSIYTLLVYLLKENVAPGWTTLSLQISIMMFLFSIMFALLAEYVLKMYRTMAPRRGVTIVREIRSPLRRQSDRLNVIGTDGSFQLGAPRDLPPSRSESELIR